MAPGVCGVVLPSMCVIVASVMIPPAASSGTGTPTVYIHGLSSVSDSGATGCVVLSVLV